MPTGDNTTHRDGRAIGSDGKGVGWGEVIHIAVLPVRRKPRLQLLSTQITCSTTGPLVSGVPTITLWWRHHGQGAFETVPPSSVKVTLTLHETLAQVGRLQLIQVESVAPEMSLVCGARRVRYPLVGDSLVGGVAGLSASMTCTEYVVSGVSVLFTSGVRGDDGFEPVAGFVGGRAGLPMELMAETRVVPRFSPSRSRVVTSAIHGR